MNRQRLRWRWYWEPALCPGGGRRFRPLYSLAALAGWLAFASIAMPGRAAADYAEVVELFRTGDYAGCVESAAKAIAAETTSENNRVLKIRAELELGRYADALATLDEGLKRLPNSLALRWIGRDVVHFNNQSDRAKQLETEIAQLVNQAPSRYSDAANRLIVGKYLLSQGADPKKVLDVIINEVKKQIPNFTPAYLAAGELALDKGDSALAAEAFERATKLNPLDPDAHFGLAQAFAPSDAARSRQALKAALDRNPNHVPSLLMMVDDLVDSERYDLAENILEHIERVNRHNPQAAAYRAVLAHLRNEPQVEEQFRRAGLRFWSTNPEVDYLIGKKLSQKYRFSEGARHQRQALQLAADHLPAKMQLAQDLLRLGQEDEGWRLAEEVSRLDRYHVVAHNLIVLQESLAKFRTLEEDGIVARMDAREAEIYGRRVLDLLKRAKRELAAKYEVAIHEPVIVEIFPRQQDFAIRTFGLPGGAGFLGVCFGTVVTANSPASQGEHAACWEATLWHEFCHVITLQKTNNKMPRWLSEGISVYEERKADAAWGQSMNPVYRKMLLDDDLTPVSRLSAAFLNPATPRHLQFAYFESSLVVEFLVETYGHEALKGILADLGKGVALPDAFARHAGPLEELDNRFGEYARKQALAMAPQADWAEPDLPPRIDSAILAAWVEDHPDNFAGLKRLARQLIEEREWDAAREALEKMERLYPRDAGSDSLYALLARVYREIGQNQREQTVLVKLAELSADNVGAFGRLTELATENGDWELTRKYALRWLAVNPLHPEPHRRAAQAAERLSDLPLAIASYRALLRLDPVDAAEIHLGLARGLEQTGELAAAKRHALLALEETPRFRAAQRRLLEIIRKLEEPSAGKSGGADNGRESQAAEPKQ